MKSGFPEEQLVQNRSAVLLFGGGEADRRGWAEEAALRLREDGQLSVLAHEAELADLLVDGRRVLLVPDVAQLSHGAQILLVKTLTEREDRPKLIIGLSMTPVDARLKGKLRDDLAYRLEVSNVDLGQPGMKTLLRERRARLERDIERRKAEAERAAREAERTAKQAARAAVAKPAKATKARPPKAARKTQKPAKKARRR